MALEKARVQLLNPESGAVLAEVDVLTSASVVAYINDKPTVNDYHNIPAGTTFTESEEKSVKDVLDAILYPDISPSIEYITDHDGEQITENKTFYIERFKDIKQFEVSSLIKAGSEDNITITFKRFNMQTGSVDIKDSTVNVQPGSTYLYTAIIDRFMFDTKYQVIVSDGKNTVSSPMISYTFIYPVYVGYCDISQVLSDDGIIIDSEKAGSYFSTLIRNKSKLLQKNLVPIQDIHGITVHDPLYHDTMAHPCIIYPNTWNKILGITDTNEDDITGSFLYNAMVPISTDPSVAANIQYSVFINRNSYNVQLAAVGEITYHFEEGYGSLDHIEEGVPSLTGFDVLCNLPVDLRTVVDTHDDLYTIRYPYNGLVTFVKEEKTFFKYDDTDPSGILWHPTNQQVFLSVNGEVPSIDIGSWNDINIDIKSGIFYRKYKNIRWEEIGRFVNSGSFVDTYKPGINYSTGSTIYFNGKYYISKTDTSSEPGIDDTWEETTVGGGIPGPVGPAGDAATITVVKTLTSAPGTDAQVENIGDEQNARLVFTIPRGEDGIGGGESASVDKTLSKEGWAADAKTTGDALASKVELPRLANGNVDIGSVGQVLISDGAGGFRWVDFNAIMNDYMARYVEEHAIS